MRVGGFLSFSPRKKERIVSDFLLPSRDYTFTAVGTIHEVTFYQPPVIEMRWCFSNGVSVPYSQAIFSADANGHMEAEMTAYCLVVCH